VAKIADLKRVQENIIMRGRWPCSPAFYKSISW